MVGSDTLHACIECRTPGGMAWDREHGALGLRVRHGSNKNRKEDRGGRGRARETAGRSLLPEGGRERKREGCGRSEGTRNRSRG